MRQGSYHNQLARTLGKSTDILTDAEILCACHEGSKQAWNALIERYEALIFSVARRMGLTESDASDVFQEVCLLLLKHLQDLRDIERLGAWLITTTRREVLRTQRRRQPLRESELASLDEEMSSPLSLLPDPNATPEESLLELENSRLVLMGLEELSAECKSLLRLLYVHDPPLSYQEVSEKLKRPLGSVGPSRARCLKSLQGILKNLGW